MTANETARADWNGSSGQTWVAEADRRDAILAPVLDELLRAAALGRGEHVLDVGCGCGATSLAAASSVGPDGQVLGIDISVPMLEVAHRRAESAALGNVRFRAADAQTDELAPTHDIAISRFGTMFFDDPTGAFANIRAGLRPGGRLCMATWQPRADNDWITVPGAALLPYGSLPPAEPGAPGMFAQASAATIRELLAPAGFAEVDVQPVQVQLRLGADAAEATDYVATLGFARSLLDSLDPSRRTEALAAVTEALAQRARADGVTLAAGILLTTALR